MRPASQSPLVAGLFGEFTLTAAGVDVTPRGRKARGLLALLCVTPGQRASRGRLADLLWSDRGEEQARASLRQTLGDLRAGALGGLGVLTIDREGVALAHGAVAGDLERVETAAAAADLAPLTAALDRMRGAFLADLDGLAPAFDDWLACERTSQHDRLLATALAAAERGLNTGDPATLSALAAALGRIEPASEAIVRLGLRVDHRAGDTIALHRRYDRLCEQLRADYGVRPSEETRDLFARLKATLSSPAPAARDPDEAPAGTAPPPPVRALPLGEAAVGSGAPPVLVVAPFVPVGDLVPAHMATAIRFEILSGLARYRDLRLAVAEGADASLAYALVATLRPTEGGLAVNPQLRRQRDGAVIWADRFVADGDDMQPAIDLMIARIVAAVMPALMDDVTLTATGRPHADLYSRYLVARHAAHRPATHAAARAAAAELEAIVAADAGFVPPKLALVRLYDTDFVWTRAGSSDAAARARAMVLARAALALDPGRVECWTHRAWCHLYLGQWDAAAEHFASALTLNPYNVERLLEVAYGMVLLGDLAAAERVIGRCLAIEPRPSDVLRADRGILRLMAGDPALALADFDMIAAPDLLMLVHGAVSAATAGEPRRDWVDAVRTGVGAILPPGVTPGLDAIMSWQRGHKPFRHAGHRAAFESGLARAFGASATPTYLASAAR